MDGDVGKIKLRRGQAIVVPADTVLILPEDSRARSVILHFIKQGPGRIKYFSAPIDDRPRKAR